jgi:hypothetical protein
MANISIKKDFKDGDKLLAQQLNNNFSVIEAGVNANEANLENVIQDAEGRLKAELENITADRGWDWNEGDRVTFFKGSEEEVKNQEVKDGQLLYNETTGETYLDNEGKRIVTGSGNVVSVGSEQPTNTATKIWIDPEDLADPVPNEIAISPTEPTTGEEVWIKKTDTDKEIYIKNDNGVYELFDKVEEPQYLQASLSSKTTLSFPSQYERQAVPFDKVNIKTGALSLNNSSVRIGKNISRIKLTVNIMTDSVNQEGMFSIAIRIAGENKGTSVFRIKSYSTYTYICLIDVKEGDDVVVALVNQETYANTIKIYGNSLAST